MNTSTLGFPLMRRRDTLAVDENSLQLLLNETIWSNAFGAGARRRQTTTTTSRRRWHIIVGYLQWIYEKSRLHYAVPIVLLIAYSLLGGLIFWSIERPHEDLQLLDKKNFIDTLKEELLEEVMNVNRRLIEFNTEYANNSYVRKLHVREFRKFALNRIQKSVYWYTLSAYYLTEHETHKAIALRPTNPESLWKLHFESNFGRIYALRNYTDQLSLRCWEIGMEGANREWNRSIHQNKVNDSVTEYNMSVGLNNVLTPVWTFWNSMFLAVTTYTTIGYGNITAKTKLGKLAAMVYAVIGIPLVLMILHKLGRFFLYLLENVWDFVMRGAEYLCFVDGGSRLKLSEEERISEMPLLLAIGVAFGWMFLCAAIFLKFEKEWDYFKSFYFFFCSLTTIGYGDVTPTNSEDMFLIFGLILVGLSLVSMCINVIQLKLEKFFEELLLTLMEEYNSDPDANNLKGGQIGMMDMWRVWKKRKGKLRNQLAEGRNAAGKAGENLAKVLPFARRRDRHHLIEELQHRLKQKDRGTQTDIFPLFRPIYEEAWTETSDAESYSTTDTCNQLLVIRETAAYCGPSRCESHPVVVQAENSICSTASLAPTSLTTNSDPKSVSSEVSKISALSTVSSHPTAASSVKSAPINPSPQAFPIDFDPNRRWTFVGTGRAPRGAPRGLIVPYMYTRPHHPRGELVDTTEVRRLLHEIDHRVQDCRFINASGSSVTSSSCGGISNYK